MSFTRAHPLMRRLLALWLLVSLLGYGSLWAMDLHGGDAASHQSATHLADVTDAASTELPADQAVEPPCDHCCHGISHLLALSGNTLAVASALDSLPAGSRAQVLISHPQSPDLRPPRA